MASPAGETTDHQEQGGSSSPGQKDGEHSSASEGGDVRTEPPPMRIRITGTESSDHHLSKDRRKGKGRSKSGDRSAKLQLSDHSTMTSAERELWQTLENTMAAKKTQVLQVLEDFGIADVEPESDALEEQIWRVVQGEITFQEAVDLV